MNLLLSFAPFVAFAILIHLGFVEGGLWAGALVALLLVIRERLLLGRSLKILEVGTALLFGALALYTLATGQAWTIPAVRLVVDGGLLAIVFASLAVGTPFTLPYAREQTPADIWLRPEFIAANRRISLVWAAAFAILVAADAAMVFVPEIPRRIDIVASVIALAWALKVTKTASGRGAVASDRSV